jgi:hypothetical protein
MCKSMKTIAFFLFVVSINLFAQGSNSLQLNGGMIMPMSSSNGFSGTLQFNYQLSENTFLYAYSGYSSWDKFYIVYREEYSEIQKNTFFETYGSDDHSQIPLYIGSRFDLHTNELFTSFLTVEAGYSRIKYNSYHHAKNIDPETGVVLNYYPVESSKTVITENLIGVGIGAGIYRKLTGNISVIISFKLNSYINSDYYDFLSANGTYTALLAGITYDI